MLYLEAEFREFLNNNFQFIESKFEDRVYIYKSDSLVLRIVQDVSGFRSMEISTVGNPDKWFDLSVLRSYLLTNDDYLKPLDFKVAFTFLINHYEKVKTSLSEAYVSTEKAISELKHLRAEKNFGYKRF